MSAIIHKLDNQTRAKPGLYTRLKQPLTDCLSKSMSVFVAQMFTGADDILFQLAENADSNEDQNLYFDTMRMLRLERKHITQCFMQQISISLQLDMELDNKQVQDDELSLVDQSEMEEMVAISTMNAKAMGLYGESVNHLQARIEFASLKCDMFNQHALNPESICYAFKDALVEIELSTDIKLILFKLFDQEVLARLLPLYQELNQVFIDQDILPQITAASAKPTSRKLQQTALTPQTSEAEQTDAVYHENSINIAPQNFQHPTQASDIIAKEHVGGNTRGSTQNQVQQLVTQFLQGDLTASGPQIPASFSQESVSQESVSQGSVSQGSSSGNNSNSSQASQYYDRRDVMRALSQVQKQISQPGQNQDSFKQQLLSEIGNLHGGAVTRQVSQLDEKTIDFIEMLFEAIVEDINISDVVTHLIQRLQILVIKVAMLDDLFFQDSYHPARVTLNLIAHLGCGISEKTDALYNTLENIVDTLINDFDLDIQSFLNSVSELESLQIAELKSAADKEAETQKSVLHGHARSVVLSTLQKLVTKKTIPKLCQKLLLKHWSTFMFHQYIKYGRSSDNWLTSVSHAKQLIEMLQPVTRQSDIDIIKDNKDMLIDDIHQSLLTTRQNPIDIECEINNLHITFEAITESSVINEQDNLTLSPASTIELDVVNDSSLEEKLIQITTLAPTETHSNDASLKISKLPADVRPGVWFEVYTGSDTPPRRAKLSVIIMDQASLVFVDRHGIKVIDKDAEIFSAELSENKSSAISDHSAFDHALGLVIHSLSNANSTT